MAWMLFSCSNDLEKVNQLTARTILPNETVEEAVFVYTDSARVRFRLTAPRLERFGGEKPYIIFPDGVKVVSYNASGEEESTLTSRYAINYEATGIMEAKDDVVVVNKKGEKLNTEHLIWDEKKEKIYSEDFVKITTEDDVVYGDGLEANKDFTHYRIHNIHGKISTEEESEEEEEAKENPGFGQ